MAPAAPAVKKTTLFIGRLNALRTRRGGGLGVELDQVKFQVRGLKNSDRAAYLSISGMIAAIEGDLGALESIAAELEHSFPSRIRCHLNVIRSFMSFQEFEKVKEIAERVADRVDNPWDASVVAYCFLSIGDLSRARATADRFAHFADAEGLDFSLGETFKIADELLTAGIEDEEVEQLVVVADRTLEQLGWKAASLILNRPFSNYGDAAPVALGRFAIAAEEDEVEIAEEAMMDALISANVRVFTEGFITASVMPFSLDNE